MDDLLEECGIEELYPEYSRLPQVIVEHRSGIGKQTRVSKAQLEKLIDDVPDVNNTAAINYWVTVGDEEVYLEGWCDKCLAGTGYPPMEGGETLAKLAYMKDMTAEILPRKARERGLELVEGGFIELEEAENLYGVTYGVYRRKVPAKYSHLPQVFPQEAELETKYPGVMVQFYGEEGYQIHGEAMDKNTGEYVARVKATTMDEAKKLLDEKLATRKYYERAQ